MESGGLGHRVRAAGYFVLTQLQESFVNELNKARLPAGKIRKIDELVNALNDASLKTLG